MGYCWYKRDICLSSFVIHIDLSDSCLSAPLSANSFIALGDYSSMVFHYIWNVLTVVNSVVADFSAPSCILISTIHRTT